MTTYEEYLYIDFENVQAIDVNSIKSTTKVKIIAGQDQTKIPFELTAKIQKFGDSIEWVKVEGKGKNALDFFIVYYLSIDCQSFGDKSFIIYSKDTGFDPLIKHLKSKKINVKRVEMLNHPITKSKNIKPDPNVQKTIDFLNTFKVNSRPKKRKTLTNAIISHLPDVNSEEINRIATVLINKGYIIEENGSVKFNLPQTEKK